MSLRVLAVSAPEFPCGELGERVLTSRDPVSLFNACRAAGELAEKNVGPWGQSNWSESRQSRRDSVMLIRSWERESAKFVAKIEALKPNLLLIGAMTPCFRGAIECSRLARELLGDQVVIILGGRHPTETIYRERGSSRVRHHPSSPLLLMAQQQIPASFDFVVSGEAEHLLVQVGEIVARSQGHPYPTKQIRRELQAIRGVPGDWILGWAEGGSVQCICSNRVPFDRNHLPSPCKIFGVTSSFPIFGGLPTIHAFSDVGSGCAYDCAFCSERRSVTGELLQLESSPERLLRQFEAGSAVISQDYGLEESSAFVEDSIFLAGSKKLIRHFVELLGESDTRVQFGCQLTIDQVLSRGDLLPLLSSVGCRYLFLGLETLEPSSIGGMSKDLSRSGLKWVDRMSRVLDLLRESGMTCGVALLFGLGETPKSRERLFNYLSEWRKTYGFPEPISLNWATQHPLRGLDCGANYDYLEWFVPPGPYIEYFRHFGEASLQYTLPGVAPPGLSEVRDVTELYLDLYR